VPPEADPWAPKKHETIVEPGATVTLRPGKKR
jgi:hypothetical protein